MIVGSTILFCSIMFWSSKSIKLLKEAIFEATKECSSKYFSIKSLEYLFTDNTPVVFCNTRSWTFFDDFNNITRLVFHLFNCWIIRENFWKRFEYDAVFFKDC